MEEKWAEEEEEGEQTLIGLPHKYHLGECDRSNAQPIQQNSANRTAADEAG